MGADISRVRFDARKNFTKVVQQQGRVALDADQNEHQDLLDRRLRAQAADLGSFGPLTGVAGTAVVPRTTPDAFKLTMVGGKLFLGRGRMYVDGILVENHGDPKGPSTVDALLDDLQWPATTPYENQPYWKPTASDAVPTTGRHLVYLEVHEREVTAVEDPDLVETALSVDTTARAQVVWRVKVHAPDVPGLTCSTPDVSIPGWPAVIAPSSSRLTVSTITVTGPQNPCSLPPSGDYRGLENQTYRVEVHQATAPGVAATFKWSRDNGSVAIPVHEVASSTRLKLDSLGRDADVLGLTTGNWVEVLDDAHELDGRPGEMRQITVHTEDQSISFAPPLGPEWPTSKSAVASAHLRVRRWDGATGTATISGGAIELEHGITVAFAGGAYRTGEYWVFAARTSHGDVVGDVDRLTSAPPLGPHRHYARLGILNGNSVDTDRCAPLWPADCSCEGDSGCCTVSVSPADHNNNLHTIQMALNSVRTTGGTVCLDVGTYTLTAPLTITGSAGVRLRGQGRDTILVASSDALVITGSAEVAVNDLLIVSAGGVGTSPDGGPDAGTAIRIGDTFDVQLDRIIISMQPGTGAYAQATTGIALHDFNLWTRITRNDIWAPVGVRVQSDVQVPGYVDDLTIEGNNVYSTATGIWSGDGTLFARDNHITRNLIEGGGQAGVRLGGVINDAAQVVVDQNQVTGDGHGIVSFSGTVVVDNTVATPSAEGAVDGGPTGIWVTAAQLPFIQATRVMGNTVTGFGRGIDVTGAGEAVLVTGNEVSQCADGIAVMNQQRGAVVEVTGNVVRQIGSEEAGGDGGIAAIAVAAAATALISQNDVSDVGTGWGSSTPIVGIGVFGSLTCRILGNTVSSVGRPDQVAPCYDYAILGTARATVEGNQSLRQLEDNRQKATAVLVADKASAFSSTRESGQATFAGDQVVFQSGDLIVTQNWDKTLEASVTIADNTLTGSYLGPAISTQTESVVTLSHNHCSAPAQTEPPPVWVRAATIVATGNRVHGGETSIRLDAAQERLTVLGNIASGGIEAAGSALAAPWQPLNLEGVI